MNLLSLEEIIFSILNDVNSPIVNKILDVSF